MIFNTSSKNSSDLNYTLKNKNEISFIETVDILNGLEKQRVNISKQFDGFEEYLHNEDATISLNDSSFSSDLDYVPVMKNGKTPLQCSITAKNLDAIHYYIQQEKMLDYYDMVEEKNIIHYAIQSRSYTIFNYIFNYILLKPDKIETILTKQCKNGLNPLFKSLKENCFYQFNLIISAIKEFPHLIMTIFTA
ncbi:MAG: hypothetical protein MHPSP_002627, partial [Paramarteilia canceri]